MLKRMLKTLRGEKGEVYVGEGVKIVLCVVLGAAILAGLVLMANKVILPRTGTYVKALFNSADGSAAYLEWESAGRPDADSMIKAAFAKKALEETDWHRKTESGAYNDLFSEAELNLFNELIETGRIAITVKGKTTYVPGEALVDEMRGNLEDGSYTPEQKQVYKEFIEAYDVVNSPDNRRKAGTMTIELEKKVNRVEDDIYNGYVAKYGGSEEALENYFDSLSDAEQEAFGLELEEKVIQGYCDAYISVGAKYGVEFTQEELDAMFR